MHLCEIEILNLWGIDEITLSFPQQVTFLTGANGCGKSTLLNVIYDTLKAAYDGDIQTTKNRFWSAKAITQDKDKHQITLTLTCLLTAQSEAQKAAVKDIPIKHQLSALKQYQTAILKQQPNVNTHIIRPQNNGLNTTIKYEIKPTLKTNQSCTAFLFQEDRNNPHNMDKINIDKQSLYWKKYNNSIDERLMYIRDEMQIYEAKLNQQIANLYPLGANWQQQTPSHQDKQLINKLQKQKQAVTKLTDTLNQYFQLSGKSIIRDEDNKFTLTHHNEQQPLHWSSLSRGEKNLIYLFLVVFLYQHEHDVFLLDEPEISMHVKWQEPLIRDLCALAPHSQFIIATHSPSLIQNGWLGHCIELEAS